MLIPTKHMFILARVTGGYCFDKNDHDCLYHSRTIEILDREIPRDAFSQYLTYFLGAYRMLFKSKEEEEILEAIDKWCERRGK